MDPYDRPGRFARAFGEFLLRSRLSPRRIDEVALRCGIGKSTWRSWRSGEHVPQAPDDDVGFRSFLQAVAASPADAQHMLVVATQAWRSTAGAKQRRRKHSGGSGPFVGRDQELKVLGGQLRVPGSCTAIWGPGGIGKTELASQIIGTMPRRRERPLTVDLQGYGTEPLSPRDALIALLESIGVAVSGETQLLCNTYENIVSEPGTVVLLDNAANAQQVLPLLPQAHGCVTVVTSRDPLSGLEKQAGALRLKLGRLQRDHSCQFLAANGIGGNKAQLDALADVCDDLPLTLNLVVGRLAGEPVATVRDYVDKMRELGIGEDVARAHIEVAYRQLPPAARTLFRRISDNLGPDLGIPAAGAMIDAAPREAERLLGVLARSNLLRRRPSERFSLHDNLRLFGRDRAAIEDDDQARRAAVYTVASFYANTTMAAARKIYPDLRTLVSQQPGNTLEFTSDQQASAWLASERHNIVATASAIAGSDAALTRSVADALRAFHQVRPHGTDWTPLAEQALRDATDSDAATRAAMAGAAAVASWAIGKHDVAADRLTQVVELYRALRKPRERALALIQLGAMELKLGRLHDARDHCSESLRLRRRTGERAGQSSVQVYLSDICTDLGELDRAAEHASEALALAEATGYTAGIAGALGNLGRIRLEQGIFDEAHEHFDAQLSLSDELYFGSRKAIAQAGLALIRHRRREHEHAIDLAIDASDTARDAGNLSTQVDALNIAGASHRELGRLAEAISHHTRAIADAMLATYQRGHVEAVIGLSAALRTRDTNQSIAHARDAVSLALNSEIALVRAPAYEALANALAAAGKSPAEARNLADSAYRRSGQVRY